MFQWTIAQCQLYAIVTVVNLLGSVAVNSEEAKQFANARSCLVHSCKYKHLGARQTLYRHHDAKTIWLIIVSVLVFPAFAQDSAPERGPAAPPIHVLYRIMFRHIAELDAAAADLDYQGKPGGDELRNQYQKAFLLSDAKAAALKSSASTCNRQLADQDSKAQQVIVAARAQDAKNAKPGQTPTLSAAALAQLNLLESQRTDISNACIQALSASLGARTFGDIDFYIRTEVAGRTLVITPPMPTPTAPLSSGSAAGKP